MKKNNKAETFVWIIVWLLIFSLVAIAILDISYFNKWLTDDYEILTIENIIKNNTDAILRKSDLSMIEEDEKFYIYKNNITKKFEILTWATNSWALYIDMNWYKVNSPNTSKSLVYKRDATLKKSLVKSYTPLSIPQIAFYFDAQDVWINFWAWTNFWYRYANWTLISSWSDKSLNMIFSWSQLLVASRPKYYQNSLNWDDSLFFDWDDYLNMQNNDYQLWTNPSWYKEKSFAFLFKTWTGIITTTTPTQVIYEQWDNTSWYALSIDSWNINAKLWFPWNNFTLNLWTAYPNTLYSVFIVQDSRSASNPYNSFSAYLNWKLAWIVYWVPPQVQHNWTIWIWWVDTSSYNPLNTTWYYFLWNILEVASWNHAMSIKEAESLQSYFYTKWVSSTTTSTPALNSIIKNIEFYTPK
jgi:hypothetical protein